MRKQNCPSCNYSWCETIKDNEMKLRKVKGAIRQMKTGIDLGENEH